MRRQTPLAQTLYDFLYPSPTPTDPPSFSAHLSRYLVPEVRIEVATFYGDLSTTEARYPGLNYMHPPHRMRLGRFKHHRRLFDAFDTLGLTGTEVQDFCCWEGTLWARERYERDEGCRVLDTTGEEIRRWDELIVGSEDKTTRSQDIVRKTDISVIVEEAVETPSTTIGAELEPPSEVLAREEHVRELARRRQHAINHRIITAWEEGRSLPPELEQYLKEQSERGNLSMDLDLRIAYEAARPEQRGVA